ncbi:MAG: hypothetical protein IPM02_02235 [Betaproteobacteria bacterium]|nr:hypothetical protein [Betaproteobacteria bacterium]
MAMTLLHDRTAISVTMRGFARMGHANGATENESVGASAKGPARADPKYESIDFPRR